MNFEKTIPRLSCLPLNLHRWRAFMACAGELLKHTAQEPGSDSTYKMSPDVPLSLEAFAGLLLANGDRQQQVLEQKANRETRESWGIARELFAPLYLFNQCLNDCGYCAYRRGNLKMKRKKSSPTAQRKEIERLLQTGYRNILLLSGELPEDQAMPYLVDAVRRVRKYSQGVRIGIEVAPLSIDGYRQLLSAGADYFVLFQEAYDEERYRDPVIHPAQDPKANYAGRLAAPSMAAAAGFKEIGIGSLLGLADPYLEALALFAHARSLRAVYPDIQLRISVPRFQPAVGARFQEAPVAVDDQTFLRIVYALRLAFPAAHLVLTAREPVLIRNRLFRVCTSLGAGGKTSVQGYTLDFKRQNEQFLLKDGRTLQQVRTYLVQHGYSTAESPTGMPIPRSPKCLSHPY